MIKKNLFIFFIFSFVFYPFISFAELSPEEEKRLKNELSVIEKEIEEQQKILSTKQNEAASISRDIAILNAQIKQAQLKIQKHNLAIDRLGKDIIVKVETINKLEEEISKGKESLAQIIRKTNYLDDGSYTEILLAGNISLSEYYSEEESFEVVKEALADTFKNLREAKSANEIEKETLNIKRNAEIDTRVNVEAEKKIIEKSEAEKKRLLSLNQKEQSAYQNIIAEKAKKAAEIRAALFELRDAAAIPFGDALELAKKAQSKTGIRPAFLLAIITQESNLGENVGSCYLTNTETGAGIGVNTGRVFLNVMKPTRDVTPFIEITGNLGRDYTKTRVSCPLSVGYGGAMGPAQFIPSTWKLFENRLRNALGVKNPDPWNPEHAFMASAMYLTDLGAIAGSYTGERNAACKYYSGRACSGSINTSYGDSVVRKANAIQANIDILEGK